MGAENAGKEITTRAKANKGAKKRMTFGEMLRVRYAAKLKLL
jgi:hypothetical protein